MPRVSNASKDSKVRSYTKKYNGNYLGIVVQNNDPSQRGRVKVFIPHVSPSVYQNWISSNTDLAFNTPGKNSDISKIIEQLKDILPWAECAAPLTGATGSGRYNAINDETTISDSNKFSTTQASISSNSVLSKYSLNKDNIGEKPARKYEIADLQLTDAFNNTELSNRVNKFSESYTPSSYSNCAKGSFSIPNVGSHVWVFFNAGDPMFPIYFATAFGNEDWKGIYDTNKHSEDGIDYPGAFENKASSDSNYNHNVETYRNKYVLSQKGGTLEIVNTDNRELLKWTHFGGSFIEFNNFTTSQLATNNDQKLVLADQFLTVKGFRSEYIGRDFEQIIQGDVYKKIGNFNRDVFTNWKTIVAQLAEIKQLFEIKRTSYFSDALYIKKVSPSQTKSPSGITGHNTCPVCTNSNREKIWNITYTIKNIPSGLTSNIFTGINQPTQYLEVSPKSQQSSAQLIVPSSDPSNFLNGGNCPCCGGKGKSPSSQGGTFDSQNKDDLISSLLSSKVQELAQIEKQLGLGGSEIINITKHKIENIGLLMNDFPSIRVDPIGKINNSSVYVLPSGVITNQTSSPLIELVHVDDLPGGSYNLNVCNKYNVLVGAGGISLKTYGTFDIGGTVVNIAGEQVNIVSENEVNIVGDKRLTLTGESIVLRHKNYGQILIDSNLGVNQNAVIGGSMHVEGELSIQHITAPAEVQETESTELVGWVAPEEVYIKLRTVENNRVRAIAPVKVNFIPHTHLFVNLPLNLTKTADGTRKVGQNCNLTTRQAPLPIDNAKKIPKD